MIEKRLVFHAGGHPIEDVAVRRRGDGLVNVYLRAGGQTYTLTIRPGVEPIGFHRHSLGSDTFGLDDEIREDAPIPGRLVSLREDVQDPVQMRPFSR